LGELVAGCHVQGMWFCTLWMPQPRSWHVKAMIKPTTMHSALRKRRMPCSERRDSSEGKAALPRRPKSIT
jgi:hypothetical protein